MISPSRSATVPPAWIPGKPTLAALGWLAANLALLFVLFRESAERAVRLWIDSPTYSYAFLIVPISIYLIADKAGRAALPAIRPSPALLLLHVPIALIWYAAVVGEVVEAQQFCLLAAGYVAIAALFGLAVVRAHLVALLLLAFLVPSGQFLILPLQVSSAQVAALLLRLSGAPLFLDGFVIQMPEASYNVESGCAGLNFVLVTIVLALIVGELFYTKLHKKIAVMAGLLAVALIANPVRIYAIILVDWLTNRTTDIVSDHLTYGWAFFAAVLAAVLPIALRYRDDVPARPATPPDTAPAMPVPPPKTGLMQRIAVTGLAGIVLSAVAPLAVLGLGMRATMAIGSLPALPGVVDKARAETVMPWQATDGAMARSGAIYVTEGRPPATVDVTLRLAPTARARLVDRWQPLAMDPVPRFTDTATASAGRAALYQSGALVDRKLWVVCFLVDGTCYPDGGSHRRAVLSAMAREPLARAGFIVLSQPGELGMPGNSISAQYRAMLALLDRVAADVSAGLAAQGK
ncbi:MAG: exosortase [Alphaproteobacteria bacterium]|nr:exosortase [Alphaproteobacteria bacterium]